LLAHSTPVGLSHLHKLLRLEYGTATNVKGAAELLNAMIQGFALQMLVDQESWDEPKVRATLSEALDLARLKLGRRDMAGA
jgi:hypothetical protein